MTVWRSRYVAVLIFLVICLIMKMENNRTDELSELKRAVAQRQMKEKISDMGKKGSDFLHEMNDPFEAFPRVMPHSCNEVKFDKFNISTVTCINDPEFNDIARGIKDTGSWEPVLAENMIKALLNYPEATYLDIGANIGTHTLVMAAMDREVVAVDAVYYNLALISHSNKRANKGKLRIVYNSISDTPGTELYPYLEKEHVERQMAGATYLVSKDLLDSGKRDWSNVVAPPVVSVTTKMILDTITAPTVIIKIDIEGYECKALSRDVIGGKVNKYIPYIFMEWMNLRNNRDNCCPDYEGFLNSFVVSGYKPLDPYTLQPVTLESANVWFDVLWVHESAKQILI